MKITKYDSKVTEVFLMNHTKFCKIQITTNKMSDYIPDKTSYKVQVNSSYT